MPKEIKNDKPLDFPKEMAPEKKEGKNIKAKDLIKIELNKLDEMRKSGADMAQVFSQCLAVLALLNHDSAIEDKIFALGKRPEMDAFVKKSQGSLTGYKVFAITIASGLLTALGGLTTGLGAFMRNADTFGKVGAGLSGVGQGTGMFGKLFDGEAARMGYGHEKQKLQTLHDDRIQAHMAAKKNISDALSKIHQADNTYHSTITEMLRSRN